MQIDIDKASGDSQEEFEDSVGDLYREKAKDKRREISNELLLEKHRHHLVRETTSTKTFTERVGKGMEVESQITVEDMYCFTCEEWVGISGVDLSGTPWSKKNAYYIDGPPEELEKVKDETFDFLCSLCDNIVSNEELDNVENVSDSIEIIEEELERLKEVTN